MALELWINGICTHHTLLVWRRGADFVLSRRELASEGLTLAGNSADVTVGVDTEVGAMLDEANQRLMVTAPDRNLVPHVFDLRPPVRYETDPTPSGLKLNYDVSAEVSDLRTFAQTGLGFSGSASYFTSHGTLLASGFARALAGHSEGVRLDTAYIVDDPLQVRRWTVGDAISGSLPWARSVRFAGFQLASDFTLRPDLVTTPLPQFFGQTAVPASVDVLIGATKVFETEVDPGPFELRNLPIVSSGSDATVVMTDVLGRQTTQTISIYDTGDLLAPGLSAYSLDTGFLRRGYGVDSFGYDRPMASATFRHGVTPALTVETQSEVSADVQMAGAGLVFAWQPIAVIDADAAGSLSKGRSGGLISAGFHSRWDRFMLFGSWSSASAGYADFTKVAGAPQDRDRLQLGISASLDRFGAVSFSEIDRSVDRGSASRLSTVSYALDCGGRSLTLSGFYDRNANRWYASTTFSVLLGPRTSVSASSSSGSADTASMSYARDADPDGGFGYRLSGHAGYGAGFDAQTDWFGEHASGDLDLSSSGSATGMRAGLNGTVVVVDKHILVARQSDGAVALVKTGLPNIQVYLEHRPVAVSDESGDALVPGLTPFIANHIGVNPDDYPISTVVETDERVAKPSRGGAVVVDLAPRKRHPLLVSVRLEDGLFPPVGSLATLGDGGMKLVVGHKGQIYIDDLTARSTVTLSLPEGVCEFVIAPPPVTDGHFPKLGPALCRPVVSGAS
ncbi:MAG TPA: fimbria/pilus outer membrane usher protein [Pirellulales bacterium]|nr:fimbria/pilus outer membrane usher protein [Pirellulales bacterium]